MESVLFLAGIFLECPKTPRRRRHGSKSVLQGLLFWKSFEHRKAAWNLARENLCEQQPESATGQHTAPLSGKFSPSFLCGQGQGQEATITTCIPTYAFPCFHSSTLYFLWSVAGINSLSRERTFCVILIPACCSEAIIAMHYIPYCSAVFVFSMFHKFRSKFTRYGTYRPGANSLTTVKGDWINAICPCH